MKAIILPGLDGTLQLRAEFCGVLSKVHSAESIGYPADLARYDELLAWIAPRLPEEDYILVGESFSGPLAISIAVSRPAHLKGVVFATSFAATFHVVLRGLSKQAMAARLRQVLEVDKRGEIAKIDVPYLYIAASDDLLVPTRAAKAFQTRRGSFVRLNGPHFILQANPNDAAQAIAEFISKLPD